MVFFIDLEANCNRPKYTCDEIISIGCVSENGDKFYSLVKPTTKLSRCICELTGLTNEDVSSAKTIDSVFISFSNWVKSVSKTDINIFYCYGPSDIQFIEDNYPRLKNKDAVIFADTLMKSMFDVQESVSKYFKALKDIKLIKLVQYFRGDKTITQSHNSLEDAEYLKEVVSHVLNDNPIKECPFKEYATEDITTFCGKVLVRNNGTETQEFENIKSAVDWIFENCIDKSNKKTTHSIINKNLRSHIKAGERYYGCEWKFVER